MAAIGQVTLSAGPFALRPATAEDAGAALAMSLDPDVVQWNSTGWWTWRPPSDGASGGRTGRAARTPPGASTWRTS